MTFDTLDLDPQILKAIAESGYTKPTKVQLEAIPKIVQGLDIRASAQTGTGKTAAFLLPALNRLVNPSQKKGKGARILILVPTRELAMQIAAQANKYSKYLNRVKTVCICGGMPYHLQMKQLSRPYDVLIATPGRLIDYINRKKIDFSRIEMLVLDEADRMLDMGFVKPVEQIVGQAPKSRQMLLFSATFQESITKLSKRFLNNPVDIIVHSDNTNHDNIAQNLYYTDDLSHKNRLLDHILHADNVNHTIVFTSTKRHADQLVQELRSKDHQAAALHGDMNQNQRTRTIMQLRKGKIKVLVATDIAARGIDVQSITHIVNFDLPRNVEDYVHRIGRTGRAGAKGIALSFVARRDVTALRKIEKFIGKKLEILKIPGLEPRTQTFKPEMKPRKKRFRRSKNTRI